MERTNDTKGGSIVDQLSRLGKHFHFAILVRDASAVAVVALDHLNLTARRDNARILQSRGNLLI